MPGTPSPLKLGFQRNSYSRVSFGNNQEEISRDEDQITQLLTDVVASDGKNLSPSSPESHVQYIGQIGDDQFEVYGYSKSTLRTIITWFWIVITGGLLRLVFHWTPHWLLIATHTCCSLDVAEKVLVIEQYQKRHKCHYVKPVLTINADNLDNLPGFSPDSSEWDCNHGEEMDMIDGTVTVDDKLHKLSVHTAGGYFKEVSQLRMFRCKKLTYVWDEDRCEFGQLRGLDKDVRTLILHQMTGLTKSQQKFRRAVYGRNEMNVPKRTVLTLLFLEVLNPFYIFQVFSFCLWFADDYVYYAATILIMSFIGIVMAVLQTRRNQSKLRSTVYSSDVATVVRGGLMDTEVVRTETLVPGDVLIVPPHGCIMHCDAVLITGNCIVNESMLTGESVPVTKTPLPCTSDLYNCKEHSKHTLFCGTHVIQTRFYGNQHVLAVVVRTGFSTAKGALVRSIMYPPPVDFKFEQDSYKFVQMLAIVASIGFIYTVITKASRGMGISEIALDALDLITIVVPPALPAAMTVGRFYAQNRLQKKDIYCISPRTINVSGSIDCVCFDKTGTLTEDGLDMWGVIPINDRKFLLPVKIISSMQIDELFVSLATCHSLTIIDNKLSGDPLDLKIFECTSWILEEPEVNDSSKFDMIFPTVVKPPKKEKIVEADDMPEMEIGIVRQFPFSSNLQRMSVITRTLGASNFQVFCKGSPEMILSLTTPQSVPPDFSSMLEEYTQEGYRVLALAYKDLRKLSFAKVDRLTREEVESQLTLLGLVVMENRLKPETSPIVEMLNKANMRTIMVTGDNMLTALSVARDCGIVPLKEKVIIVHGYPAQLGRPAQLCYTHSNYNSTPRDMMVLGCTEMTTTSSVTSFVVLDSDSPAESESRLLGQRYSFALTGHTWAILITHFPEAVERVVARGAVFARMSPDQKQQLVQQLQKLGYYVAMCGDGANDCGALKVAHAGISLSEAESSVASPFTSKRNNISCVPQIIREGRAALVTSFGIFKYMAAYSLTQFVSVMILYTIDTNLTDKEFLYIDLFLITVFAFFSGRTEAYSGPLVKSPPTLSLISVAPITSLLLQMLLVIMMQCAALFTVRNTEWFVPLNSTASIREKEVPSFENYSIFSISSLQYIILAIIFSRGAPYRKSIFNNYGFLISLFVLTSLTMYIILDPFEWLRDQLILMMPPTFSFRILMIGYGIFNLAIACVIEYFLVDFVIVKKLGRSSADGKSRRYLAVDRELYRNQSWPPISSQLPSDRSSASDDSRPPRSPAAITEIRVARRRVSSLVEVTLNPASLVERKRRHCSETESVPSRRTNGTVSNPIQLEMCDHRVQDLQ